MRCWAAYAADVRIPGQVCNIHPVPTRRVRFWVLLLQSVLHEHLHGPLHPAATVLQSIRCATLLATSSRGAGGQVSCGQKDHVGPCCDLCLCLPYPVFLCVGRFSVQSVAGVFRVGSVGQDTDVQLIYPAMSSSCAWYLTPTKYVGLMGTQQAIARLCASTPCPVSVLHAPAPPLHAYAWVKNSRPPT